MHEASSDGMHVSGSHTNAVGQVFICSYKAISIILLYYINITFEGFELFEEFKSRISSCKCLIQEEGKVKDYEQEIVKGDPLQSGSMSCWHCLSSYIFVLVFDGFCVYLSKLGTGQLQLPPRHS